MSATRNTAFPKLMHDKLLEPIGMIHSTYEQPLPADMQAEAATPYPVDDFREVSSKRKPQRAAE